MHFLGYFRADFLIEKHESSATRFAPKVYDHQRKVGHQGQEALSSAERCRGGGIDFMLMRKW